MSVTVYAAIGNSDNKLPQSEWADYIDDFRNVMRKYADEVFGEWYSAPDSPYQNVCIAIDVLDDDVAALHEDLVDTRETYDQESIAWSVVSETEFI